MKQKFETLKSHNNTDLKIVRSDIENIIQENEILHEENSNLRSILEVQKEISNQPLADVSPHLDEIETKIHHLLTMILGDPKLSHTKF